MLFGGSRPLPIVRTLPAPPQVTFVFTQPFESFYDAGVGENGISPDTVANFVVTSSYIDSAFTHFQLAGEGEGGGKEEHWK